MIAQIGPRKCPTARCRSGISTGARNGGWIAVARCKPQLRESHASHTGLDFKLRSFARCGCNCRRMRATLNRSLHRRHHPAGRYRHADQASLGGRAVLDFKWTSAPYWHRKKIREGTALQLAIYSWLLERPMSRKNQAASDRLPPAGFICFATASCSSPLMAYSRDTLSSQDGSHLDETWKVTLEAYERTLAEVRPSTITATGIIDTQSSWMLS